MANTWNYSGDVNLEYGGLFWRFGGDDYAEAVEVIDLNGASGGPENQFLICEGSIYFSPQNWNSALDCCGYCHPPTYAQVVDAFNAYQGFDGGTNQKVQIGKNPIGGNGHDWQETADIVLHGNVKLRRYIEQKYL